MILKYLIIALLSLVLLSGVVYKKYINPVVQLEGEALGFLMIDALCDGFFEGLLSGISETEESIKNKSRCSFIGKYAQSLAALGLSGQDVESWINILTHKVYLPGRESGFKVKMIIESNKELEKLNFYDTETAHSAGLIIGHWMNEAGYDWFEDQKIVESLPGFFVKKLYEII
jgi:hypothetical protein